MALVLLFCILCNPQPQDTTKHSHVDSLVLADSLLTEAIKQEVVQIQRIEDKLQMLLEYLNSQSFDLIREAVASDSTRRDN